MTTLFYNSNHLLTEDTMLWTTTQIDIAYDPTWGLGFRQMHPRGAGPTWEPIGPVVEAPGAAWCFV